MNHTYYPDRPEEFRWIETDGGVKVIGYRGTKNFVRIPGEIQGKPVVAIGTAPFDHYSVNIHILIPPTVRCIDPEALCPKSALSSLSAGWFHGFELEDGNPYLKEEGSFLLSADGKKLLRCFDPGNKITIPEGVTVIARDALLNCRNMNYLVLPSTLEVIEDRAFAKASLFHELTLPEGTRKVGYGLFDVDPGDWRQPSCRINVPASVEELGGGDGLCWIGLENNPHFQVQGDYVLSPDGKKLHLYIGDSDCTDIEIPEGVEEIQPHAFASAKYVKKLVLPTTLKVIRKNAFPENKVKTLRLPAALETIEDGAFPYNGLSSILVDKKNTHLYTDKTCLYRLLDGGKMELLCCFRNKIEQYAVAEGTVRILPGAFSICSVLTNLTLPESLESFHEECLGEAVKNLVLPRNVREITFRSSGRSGVTYTVENNPYLSLENNILYQNTEEGIVAIRGLDSSPIEAVLKEGTVRVADEAFYGNVKKLVCPSSLRHIGKKAFFKCKLEELSLNEDLQTIDDFAFFANPLKHIRIPSSVTYISQYAFVDCPVEEFQAAQGSEHYSSMDGVLYNADKTVMYKVPSQKEATEFVVPETVEDIAQAFAGCARIKAIRLPSGLKTLWRDAISKCSKLKHLYANPGLAFVHNDFIDFDIPTVVHADPNSVMLDFMSGLTLRNIYNLKLRVSVNGMEELATLSKEYELMPNPTGLTISKYLGKALDVVIPSTIGKYTITAIGPNAFAESNCKINVTSIVVPDSVTVLDCRAFAGCKNLHKLVLGTGIREIGSAAFHYCEKLEEVIIPEGVEEIGDYTFYGCKILNRVVFPASISKISNKLFSDVNGFKDLYLNNSCLYYAIPGSYAETFLRNYDVSSSYGRKPLNVMHALPDSGKSCEEDEKYLLYLDCKPLEDGTMSVSIKRNVPDSVTQCIIPATLRGMTVSTVAASQYVLPEVFQSISIPASVTSLELPLLSRSWSTDAYMRSVDVAQDNPCFWSDGHAIYTKDRSRLLRMLTVASTSYTVHPETKIISSHAFSGLSNLTHLVLPEGLETIEDSAFNNALEEIEGIGRVPDVPHAAVQNLPWYKKQTEVYLGTTLDRYRKTDENTYTVLEGTRIIAMKAFQRDIAWNQPNPDALEEVILPDSVEIIGDLAFTTRYGIKSIRLSGSLKELKSMALHHCRALKTIHLPASVEVIHPTALPNHAHSWNGVDYCSLEEITVEESNPHFKSVDGILYSADGTTLIRVPPCYDANTFTVPQGVHTIANNAFCFLTRLQTVILPESVHTIEENGFHSCLSLTQIVMPGVKTIGSNAFRKCEKLKKVTLPDGLELIGEKAFSETAIEQILVPKSVKTIGNCAFSHCSEITLFDSIDPDVKPADQRKWSDAHASTGYIATRDRELGYLWHDHTITVRCAQTGEIQFVFPMFSDNKQHDHNSLLTGSWGGHADFHFAKLDEFFSDIKGTPLKLKTALFRIKYPLQLSDKAKDTYLAYISKMAKDLVKSCVDSADMESLVLCAPLGVLKKNNIDELIEYATNAKATEFAAYLLSYKEEHFASKKGASRGPSLSIKAGSLWTNPKAGTSKIGRYKGNDPVVEFPTEWNGKPISGIAGTTSKVPDNYKTITDVVIPEGYVSIGDYAFYGCEMLERVTLPSTLETIGRHAFANCPKIREIVLPDRVESVGECCFSGCEDLESIQLSHRMDSIEAATFSKCKKLSQLDLPENIHRLAKDALVGTGLDKLIIRSLFLYSDGAVFWNTPNLIYTYADAEIRVFDILKKSIRYMTIAQQASDTVLDIQADGNTFCIGLESLDSLQKTGAKDATALFSSVSDGNGLVNALEKVYPGALRTQKNSEEIARLQKLAEIHEFTVTETKRHYDGDATTILTRNAQGQIFMKARERFGTTEQALARSKAVFVDLTAGASLTPSTEVVYSEVDSILFEGKIFVLTGFSSTEEGPIIQTITEKGGQIKSSVVLKTDYLIVNENYGGITTKYAKAMELNKKGKNILVLSGSRFKELSK